MLIMFQILKPTFPDGLDVETFTFEHSKNPFKCKKVMRKNYVTQYIKKSKYFKEFNFKNEINLSKYNWSVDEQLILISF